jgi:hypothetical protein
MEVTTELMLKLRDLAAVGCSPTTDETVALLDYINTLAADVERARRIANELGQALSEAQGGDFVIDGPLELDPTKPADIQPGEIDDPDAYARALAAGTIKVKA